MVPVFLGGKVKSAGARHVVLLHGMNASALLSAFNTIPSWTSAPGAMRSTLEVGLPNLINLI